ncbi:DeoR/GlpR family DNA-binding transcription regulator [Paenibacillus timonensis]|uniref:DeoR/GlpR family DNA-binding transcription regulator n=1 Tax=Paenibacillus timonensis TaxID=225915 RepID=A0ABW3SCA5_9BACL|nr:DeoR/GlpR family DNA-binding transcription regulator [Paenibacillus timonensis]MCH1640918.1 DeoR/GlpR family DNA-binding transcription regulator [Paenibacillus timonensis]
MLNEERYRRILRRLQEKGIVKLQELCTLLEASESTVRRDLADLEERGLLRRVHGGAALPAMSGGLEPGMAEKSAVNVPQKQKIAELASGLVRGGEAIYLDAGTTTLAMIPFLKGKSITVVTNGLPQMDALLEADIPSYLLGGLAKKSTKALVGSLALDNLDRFRFDRCFLGTNGVHPDAGYTTPDPEEAALKRRASELSSLTYMLADSSKIGNVAFTRIMGLEQATLIAEQVPERWRKPIEDMTNLIGG